MKISVIGMGNVGQQAVMNLFEMRVGRQIYCFDIPGGQVAPTQARIDEIIDSHEELGPDLIATNNPKDLKDSEIVVITAGRPRKAEETRDDLAKNNAKIISSWSNEVKKYAPKSILIIVTNPVAAMTAVALKITGFSPGKVIGIGPSLDARRVVREFSRELGLTGTHMQGYILGDHGDSMVIPLETFTIYGQSLISFIQSQNKQKEINVIKDKMRTASQYLIEGLRQSPWLGPGEHIASLCQHIYYGPEDPKKGTMTNALVKLEGEYGIKGVLGVPIKIGRHGVIQIIELDNLTAETKAKLATAATHIQNITKIALATVK